jgi:hypothetical protein
MKFYSICYEGYDTVFQIGDEDDHIEEHINEVETKLNTLNVKYDYSSESTWEFKANPYEMHSTLVKLGFEYGGVVYEDCLNTEGGTDE